MRGFFAQPAVRFALVVALLAVWCGFTIYLLGSIR